MAKYGKNNYFDGVVLPEPKEEALRRMAKGVNTTRGYLYERSIDIDKYNGDRSFPSGTYTSRRLKVTVHSVKMLGCIAEYLPQNLIPTAEGSVVKWLDSAPQLPEANGILPPLDASVGGYDLAAIGNPKIII